MRRQVRTGYVCVLGIAALGCSRSDITDYSLDASVPDDVADVNIEEAPGPDSGPDVITCNPKTCAGCCESDGHCAPGNTAQACGMGGESCVACPADGYCNKPEPGCNIQLAQCTAQNCAGCCYLTPPPTFEFCSTGTHTIACGHAGAQCLACDTVCTPLVDGGGACEGPPTCSPKNCTGCCFGDICAVGDQNIACGVAGVACVDCAKSNQGCKSGSCS